MTEQMKPGDAVLVRAVVDRTGHANGPIALVNVLDGEAYFWMSKDYLTTEAEIRRQAFRDAAAMLRTWARRMRYSARHLSENEQVDAEAAADEIGRLDVESELLEQVAKDVEQMGGEEKSDD